MLLCISISNQYLPSSCQMQLKFVALGLAIGNQSFLTTSGKDMSFLFVSHHLMLYHALFFVFSYFFLFDDHAVCGMFMKSQGCTAGFKTTPNRGIMFWTSPMSAWLSASHSIRLLLLSFKGLKS